MYNGGGGKDCPTGRVRRPNVGGSAILVVMIYIQTDCLYLYIYILIAYEIS